MVESRPGYKQEQEREGRRMLAMDTDPGSDRRVRGRGGMEGEGGGVGGDGGDDDDGGWRLCGLHSVSISSVCLSVSGFGFGSGWSVLIGLVRSWIFQRRSRICCPVTIR